METASYEFSATGFNFEIIGSIPTEYDPYTAITLTGNNRTTTNNKTELDRQHSALKYEFGI